MFTKLNKTKPHNNNSFLVNSFWDGPAVFTNLVEIKDLFIKVEISHIVPTPLVKTKPHNNNSFFGK